MTKAIAHDVMSCIKNPDTCDYKGARQRARYSNKVRRPMPAAFAAWAAVYP